MQFVLQQITSLDFWTFIVAFLALLATASFGYKTLRKQDEQLELARREAERHPILKVSEMNLIDAREVDAVLDTAKKREEWLEEIRQYEERQRATDEKIAKGLSFAMYDGMEIDPRINRIYDADLIAQEDYDGPFPDKVLRVSLIDLGKSAALDVAGQLFINTNYLQPLAFPGLDGNIEDEGEGICKVSMGTGTGSRLLPAPTDEVLTFDIAVLIKIPGATYIRYAFATPQGDNVDTASKRKVLVPCKGGKGERKGVGTRM